MFLFFSSDKSVLRTTSMFIPRLDAMNRSPPVELCGVTRWCVEADDGYRRMVGEGDMRGFLWLLW
jgi:hypothetical protein